MSLLGQCFYFSFSPSSFPSTCSRNQWKKCPWVRIKTKQNKEPSPHCPHQPQWLGYKFCQSRPAPHLARPILKSPMLQNSIHMFPQFPHFETLAKLCQTLFSFTPGSLVNLVLLEQQVSLVAFGEIDEIFLLFLSQKPSSSKLLLILHLHGSYLTSCPPFPFLGLQFRSDKPIDSRGPTTELTC